MENKELRVTGCIYDRFAVMFDTDNDSDEKQKHNFAHNCALALDYIGAGKIAKGEAYDLMLRAINNDFKNEKEICDYIAQIRAERKKRTMSVYTQAKSKAKKLLKMGFNCSQIAPLVNLSESEIIEIARTLDKE